MPTPLINKQLVLELSHAIIAWQSRRISRNQPGLYTTAEEYQAKGLTPHRFRTDLRRAVTGPEWLNHVRDVTPGLTDEALDTAVRNAIKEFLPDKHWMTSQPLRR